jgi:hypothetical protein
MGWGSNYCRLSHPLLCTLRASEEAIETPLALPFPFPILKRALLTQEQHTGVSGFIQQL